MTDLVLWSGGLDSTWTLWKLAQSRDLVALSVTLKTSDPPLRQTHEADARKAIKPHFPGVWFMDAALDISTCTMPNKDVANCVYIAAQYARGLRMGPSDTIWMGGNADDDRCNEGNDFSEKRKVWGGLLFAAYQIADPPRINWIMPAPTRAQQISDLGALAGLTWSCRDPQPHECGQCTPCRFINAARRQISGDAP